MRKNAVTPCILAALFDIAPARCAPSPMPAGNRPLPRIAAGGFGGSSTRQHPQARRRNPRPMPSARLQVSPNGCNGRPGTSLIP